MAERRFAGRPASPGLAIGPLVRIGGAASAGSGPLGTPAEEEAALRQALVRAGADLEALAAVAAGDGAAILAFQIEMLEDPALIEDVLAMIGAGSGALAAWQAGLAAQIEGYEAADDDYFRARASDLLDLKDRVGRALSGVSLAIAELPAGAIILDHDLTPSRFLGLDRQRPGGIALAGGSANSHVAMLARARGVPMAVGLAAAGDEGSFDEGTPAVLDADAGLLVVAPTARTRSHYQMQLGVAAQAATAAAAGRYQPAVTVDGQRIEVLVNVDDPGAIDDDTLRASDGVGLLRTEFLFLGRTDLPGEDEQFHAYATLVDRLAGRPAIIRTLDIGGDKPLAGLRLAAEANPFLGLRGIRLCLEHQDLFRPQIRALLRAAVGRPLRVMLPMVTVQAEIDQARHLFAACLAELKAEAVPAALPPIGIMVETPAAAIAVDRLDATFYSIGSNDLLQYVMAAARDAGGRVADLLDPAHPAIVRLIEGVAAHGGRTGREVGLCGDMASAPALVPLLLRAGLRKLSVAPAALDRVKRAVAAVDLRKDAGAGA